jgi:hypothetical protein
MIHGFARCRQPQRPRQRHRAGGPESGYGCVCAGSGLEVFDDPEAILTGRSMTQIQLPRLVHLKEAWWMLVMVSPAAHLGP